jgi:hypothetical protein
MTTPQGLHPKVDVADELDVVSAKDWVRRK